MPTSDAGSDNIATATLISAGDVSTPTLTTSATIEVDEYTYYGNPKTVWWKYVASGSTLIKFSTYESVTIFGHVMDTTMQVFSGPADATSFAELTWLGQSDDVPGGRHSEVIAEVTSGQTYYIQCCAYDESDEGSVQLSATELVPPPNNNLSDAARLEFGFRSASVQTEAATFEVGETYAYTGKTAWYYFDAQADVPVQLDWNGSDLTYVQIYTCATSNPSSYSQLFTVWYSDGFSTTQNFFPTETRRYWLRMEARTSIIFSIMIREIELASRAIRFSTVSTYDLAQGRAMLNGIEYVYSSQDYAGFAELRGNQIPYLRENSLRPQGALLEPDTQSYISLDEYGFNRDIANNVPGVRYNFFGADAPYSGASAGFMHLVIEADESTFGLDQAITVTLLRFTVGLTWRVRGMGSVVITAQPRLYLRDAENNNEYVSCALTSGAAASSLWNASKFTYDVPVDQISAWHFYMAGRPIRMVLKIEMRPPYVGGEYKYWYVPEGARIDVSYVDLTTQWGSLGRRVDPVAQVSNELYVDSEDPLNRPVFTSRARQ